MFCVLCSVVLCFQSLGIACLISQYGIICYLWSLLLRVSVRLDECVFMFRVVLFLQSQFGCFVVNCRILLVCRVDIIQQLTLWVPVKDMLLNVSTSSIWLYFWVTLVSGQDSPCSQRCWPLILVSVCFGQGFIGLQIFIVVQVQTTQF